MRNLAGVSRESLPADIQKQIEIAQNNISIMNGDVNRLSQFKMSLEIEVASLDDLIQKKQLELSALTKKQEAITAEVEKCEKQVNESRAIHVGIEKAIENTKTLLVQEQESLNKIVEEHDELKSIFKEAKLALSATQEENQKITERIKKAIEVLKNI